MDLQAPRIRRAALTIWQRNLKVWSKLIGASLIMNLGEPILYLLGLGLGLGLFIGDMDNMSYLTFFASGIMAASTMHSASFEGMYSVFTRMDTQKSYDAMLMTPLDVDDILAGEMLWCASKSVLSGLAILIVATVLGAVADWHAIMTIPIILLIGLSFSGPAIVMAAISPSYDFFVFYQTLVLTPMFIACGVFYPTSALPDVLSSFIQILPLTHAIALLRPLIAGHNVASPLLHIFVLIAYASVSYYIAVILVRRRLLV